MLLAVLAGFASGALAPLIRKYFSVQVTGLILAIIPASIFIYLSSLAGTALSGTPVIEKVNWVPDLGINFEFYLDGLSLMMSMLISGIGTLIFLYSSSYLAKYEDTGKFFAYLSMFMAAMLGVVLSSNLMTLFIFWELTSLTSFLLIGFKHKYEKSRYSALQALLVTGTGGIAFLAGILILYSITGTYSIPELAGFKDVISRDELAIPAIILILLGAFTKSAQFPFHFWLPNAMEAPTPVSAYLHSATMVKAGIFLMARLNPYLSANFVWSEVITYTGLVTMIFAALISLKQNDLKKILAYTTVSVLGILTFLIGLNSDYSLKTLSVFLLAHSLYKAALFLTSGSVDYATGSRDPFKLGGLLKKMPVTGTAALISAVSMIGILPAFGFIAKEMFYTSISFNNLFLTTGFLTAVILTYAALMAGVKPFIGNFQSPKETSETPVLMWVGPGVLATLSLLFGLFPEIFTGGLIRDNYKALSGLSTSYILKLWHGVNFELILSLITILCGFVLYLLRDKIFNVKIPNIKFIKPSFYYDVLFNGVLTVSKLQTKFLQNGSLRYYFVIIILFSLGLPAFVFFTGKGYKNVYLGDIPGIYEIVLGIIVLISVIVAVSAKSRFLVIAILGVIGYMISLLYILLGAPDLAMTQFAVETLTVVLFVLVIYKLPKFLTISAVKHRIRDSIIAISAGVFITLLMISVYSVEMKSEMKEYFGDNSYILANGRNIVNVILVDFRALDTLGEITVLGIAAAGVFGLIKVLKKDSK